MLKFGCKSAELRMTREADGAADGAVADGQRLWPVEFHARPRLLVSSTAGRNLKKLTKKLKKLINNCRDKKLQVPL